jgi:hypothetical protein
MYSTVGIRSTPAVRGHRRMRPRPVSRRMGLAAEHVGAYDATPRGPSTSEVAAQPEPPLGLLVLTEVPALAAVLDRLSAADDALLDAVAGLADLLADDTVEEITGVGIEHWLAAITAQTRMDRRLLVRMCRLLRRLPTLHTAVRDHRLSFAQLRGLTIGLRDARKELDHELDRLIGALLDELDRLERPDPDVLVRQVVDALDELARGDLEAREQEAAHNRFLHLQPHRDGTGGRLVAEIDAAGLALLDAATTPSADAVEAAGGHGAARLDALLDRVAGSVPPVETDSPNGDPSSEGTSSRAWTDALAAPRLLIRLPFDALFDERLPADLLTTLIGGRLRLTSQTARQLVDRAGARLRAVVVDDDGTVVGVGRATRQPPGFLSDAGVDP